MREELIHHLLYKGALRWRIVTKLHVGMTGIGCLLDVEGSNFRLLALHRGYKGLPEVADKIADGLDVTLLDVFLHGAFYYHFDLFALDLVLQLVVELN